MFVLKWYHYIIILLYCAYFGDLAVEYHLDMCD